MAISFFPTPCAEVNAHILRFVGGYEVCQQLRLVSRACGALYTEVMLQNSVRQNMPHLIQRGGDGQLLDGRTESFRPIFPMLQRYHPGIRGWEMICHTLTCGQFKVIPAVYREAIPQIQEALLEMRETQAARLEELSQEIAQAQEHIAQSEAMTEMQEQPQRPEVGKLERRRTFHGNVQDAVNAQLTTIAAISPQTSDEEVLKQTRACAETYEETLQREFNEAWADIYLQGGHLYDCMQLSVSDSGKMSPETQRKAVRGLLNVCNEVVTAAIWRAMERRWPDAGTEAFTDEHIEELFDVVVVLHERYSSAQRALRERE